MRAAHSTDGYFDAHRERILEDWFELLRMPTVGADKGRAAECARCAAWLKRWVRSLGFEVEVCRTSGHPVLLAERPGRPGSPTVLFYGHYDVQPADPVEEWHSPPFEPVLRGDRVYARGAQDNKGQLLAALLGMRACIEAGLPLPGLRLLIEGEEESGSRGLAGALPGLRRRLQADVLMVCDTALHPSGRPAITAGLRGLAYVTVTVHGPDHDLHSGTHGGVAPNPAVGLARLVASLHDADGNVAVAGFCDRLSPPSAQEIELCRAEPFDAEAYQRATGVAPEGGARGVPVPERAGFRPTIEVNGLRSGYAGAGLKTIIPASALAKISLRLCPEQDPDECLDALLAHLRERCPAGLRLEFQDRHAGGAGFRLPVDSPLSRLAADVLTGLDGRGPAFVWEGASIPVVGALRAATGAAPLLVGFGCEADRIHAPDESFSLAQFDLALAYSARMLSALAGG
jgi:acetylornithine deacetylase/succinyl-diaminopimelate desuccinylase-like protein